MPLRRRLLLASLAMATVSCRTAKETAGAPPFPPAESIRHMKVEDGWRVEPVIAEPDVIAPAAMDWDEQGRVYVAENPGYPLNVEGKVGKIKLLEDTTGDGLPDRSTLFADKLTLPTGVMRWKRGILVTDAPEVWYMEDTDNDGKADVRTKVLTGFALTNPQHTVNGLVYGLDNWIYLAHENPTTAIVFKDKFGDRGTDIRFAGKADSPTVKQTGRGIRFRPGTFQLEALSGTSQFGHAFDDWGHHFTMNNTYHARHEVIAARYLNRNPNLPLASSLENISSQPKCFRLRPGCALKCSPRWANSRRRAGCCGTVMASSSPSLRTTLFIAPTSGQPAPRLRPRGCATVSNSSLPRIPGSARSTSIKVPTTRSTCSTTTAL
jgi:hypothetical protein